MIFKEKLSDYNLFHGQLSDLNPNPRAVSVELASTLFTDYTDKSRIIMLPLGKKMTADGNDLPSFPEGTIIAKTFYYKRSIKNNMIAKSILETRLLIRHESKWNTAVYLWNKEQNEAFLAPDGKKIPVAFLDPRGKKHSTNYAVPSTTDCITCHRQDDQVLPIGLKIANMNRDIIKNNHAVNQLLYLQQQHLLELSPREKLLSVTSYKDTLASTEKRARAYLNINCAHCHNPKGIAAMTQLDLRDLPQSNPTIWLKQGKIAMRITTPGELHMPKIGTTLQDEEGVRLVLNYINGLKNK
jgi:uncharacterized repeat protein (TIGR03806 family)